MNSPLNFDKDQDENQDSEQIESQINQTRSRMDNTINEIGEKLKPAKIVDAIKDETKQRLRSVGSKINETAHKAGDKIKRGYDVSVDETKQFALDHPMYLALGALGAGIAVGYWLRSRGSASSMGLGQKAEDLFQKGKEVVREGVRSVTSAVTGETEGMTGEQSDRPQGQAASQAI